MGFVLKRWFSREREKEANDASGRAGARVSVEDCPPQTPADDARPETPTDDASPADEAALKEFLEQNFLYEEPSAAKQHPPLVPLLHSVSFAPPPAKEVEEIEAAPASPSAEEPSAADEVIKTAAEGPQPDMEEPANEEAPLTGEEAETIATGDAAGTVADELQAALLSIQEAKPKRPAGEDSGASFATEHPHIDSTEWKLEEALGAHREWVESQGVAGKKADLSRAGLEGTELIGVNLRYADLGDANLTASDLLLADLRDACLVRTNLQEACLVGANLEGANLEGASLESAMGLVPRQLAGANLRDASLPAQVAEFPALGEFTGESAAVARFFGGLVASSLVSWLIIWKTKDVQLLTDSSIIPFLRSSALAMALPTGEIYLIAPVALFILYLVFHYHAQRLWDAVLELPAVFPDGRVLGENGPRIVTGLARAHFRWMSSDSASTRFIEKGAAMILAYWLVPVTLILFWARYLTLQEIHGTILQELLAVAAMMVAIISTFTIGRQQERWVIHGKSRIHVIAKLKTVRPTYVAIGLLVFFTFLSLGAIRGVPHDADRAPQFSAADFRRWAPNVFWSMGFDPTADLTEAAVSTKAPNWTGSDDQLASVKGARLNGSHFRYAQAYGIFLANAHLWRSDFQGAFMSQADLRGADLGQSSLKYAVLDRAQLRRANLDRANLDGANLSRADLREANLSYSSAVKAILVDARLDDASLYGVQLQGATLIRANLEKADLREAVLDGANLTHADMQQAYLWSAKLPGANLEGAQLAGAIFIDANLRGANLKGAQCNGTVLTGADLHDANLDEGDLRGVLGLSASQVCSARTRSGAKMDDTLQAQVDAQCGAAH